MPISERLVLMTREQLCRRVQSELKGRDPGAEILAERRQH